MPISDTISDRATGKGRAAPSPSVPRRSFLLGLAALGLAVTLGRPASAASTAQAEALVGKLSGELTQIVNSGRGEGQVYAGFESLLARYADMPAVSASVLGPPWRGATQAQKQAFVAAFQHYLSRRYGKQFREYRNARIEITGARDGGKAGVLVTTRVVRPGQESIAVDWQISDRSGSTRVVNLIIEGVSMLASERAQVGAMLEAQRGSIDGLIAQLRATG
ncbi:phospholipid-binding protein MlaC [Amaricoccus sp.]|uniref:MlaC/ttg2D family ABC transporter substrate-binding protein n=1 Tax=Amaricoccus sp. TaxID=1872485 RepID=UPI00261A5F2C|nr:ABC transporter substrate-binding protein [Amaricoccus sp.]HRO11798.1 ABC transporter substrate-binding protein [Amaricoccus sp.]